ncbi:hypothetical protein BDV12DRAFT_209263 [Aspergillus spectabilis]
MTEGTEDIFQKALKSINSNTKASPNAYPPPQSHAELYQRIREIDKKFNENTRNSKVWTNLDRILALFETTGNIINAAVSSTLAPASLIMSSFLHLIATARGSVASYQSIGDFLGRVAGTLDRMTIHDGTIVDPILGEILAKTVVLVSEILVVASSYLGKRRKRDIGKEFLVRLFFGACSELEMKMTALQDLAQEEAMTCISLIRRDTSMLHDELQEMSTTVQRIDRNTERQRFEVKLGLETWHSNENIHDGIQKERRAAVKARWIVDEPLVKKWIRGETSRVIWIHGEPGVGKSFATSQLITEIAIMRKIHAYFYVRENDSATTIFKCLALQLAVRSRGFNFHAVKALEVLDSRQWRTFVIIDGLDAAHPSEQKKVVDILRLFNRRAYVGKTTFHIAIISRSDLYLLADTCSTESRIHVSSEKTESDIAQYIRKRFSDKKRFKDLEPADREHAIEKLTREANGMFLWVSLVIAQAEEMGSRNDILNFLDTGYPKDHANHLGRLLDSAAEKVHDPAQFRTFLRWIACARRPLKASEVRFLPGSQTGLHEIQRNTTFSKVNLEKNFKHLLSFKGDCNSSDTAEVVIQFRHRCFKDHLLCDLDTVSSRPHSFSNSAAHASIFKTCLSLLQDSFAESGSDTGVVSLVNYAADHIVEHFVEIEVEKEELGYEAKQQMRDLLQDPMAIQRWYDAMSARQKMNVLPALLETPRAYQKWIYWAAGYHTSVKEFFKSLAIFCAEGWLRTGAVNMRTALLFLHRYDYISHLSSDRIIKLAKVHAVEQNANWHVRVASALREANHIQDAIKQYREAETKDPNNWLIKSGFSMACAADGQYEKAIRQAHKALKCVPRPTGGCRSNIYFNLSVWNGIRGKAQAQIDNAKWAYSAHSESLARIAHYFTLFELCKTLKKKDGAKTRDSWLVKLLSGAAVEGRDKQNIDFAAEVLRVIVKVANGKEDSEATIFAQYQVGRFHLRYQRDETQARKVWEKLTESARHDSDAELYARQLQCRALAELYLRGGLIAAKDSQGNADKRNDKSETKDQEHPDIAKLRALASGRALLNNNIEYCADAAALLGYWQRKHGPKKRNKDLFRARICQGIQMLEDEDPLNDVDGYVILGKALLIAGYADDAKRLFATVMLFSQNTTPDTKQRIPLVCHNKPDCRDTDYEKLYICHICNDTTLCGTCWKIFKDKKTGDTGPPYTTCHSSQLFSNIYHRGHKIAEPIAVMEGDKMRPDTEWLTALKKNWDISEDTKAAVSLATPRTVMESRRMLQLVD